MLAIHPQMDSLQNATSFRHPVYNLEREHSAEDLDAAHQLVSSARRGRDEARPDISPSWPAQTSSPGPQTHETSGASEVQFRTRRSKYADDPQAQVCRYAHILSSFTFIGRNSPIRVNLTHPRLCQFVLPDAKQQLWHFENSSLATFACWSDHLQRLRFILEEPSGTATRRQTSWTATRRPAAPEKKSISVCPVVQFAAKSTCV